MSEQSLLSGQASTEAGTQQGADQGQQQAADASAGAGGEQQGQQQGQEQQGQQQDAPESYDFQMPEGFELNSEITEQFTAYAKDLKLPQDKAQAVVDMGVRLVESFQSKQAEAFQQQQATWRNEVTADKEIGGDKLEENLGYAARALDTFAPDLRQVLNDTGLGNHPAFVRAFVKIGKAISEDRLVGGEQHGKNQQADARSLYSASNMNP